MVMLHDPAEKAGYSVELTDIELVPWNEWIVLERGLPLLTEVIHWLIDFLELSTSGVSHDARPGLIGFA
jgi:hypothetical protein